MNFAVFGLDLANVLSGTNGSLLCWLGISGLLVAFSVLALFMAAAVRHAELSR